MKFSAPDKDNDNDSGSNCALSFNSGWWFNSCFVNFILINEFNLESDFKWRLQQNRLNLWDSLLRLENVQSLILSNNENQMRIKLFEII